MKKILLHLEGDPKPSSFDQIAAYDSGVDRIIAYGGVAPEEVEGLVYGAMFTRGGDDLKNSAVFIGGSNVVEAEVLFEKVKKTVFDPFKVSAMFDANGSNTTAAAAVVKIVKAVGDPKGKKAVVLAGTGPVGSRAAVMLAGEGCDTYITSRKLAKAEEVCARLKEVFDVEVTPLEVNDDESCKKALEGAQVAFTTGKLGIVLLKKDIWASLPELKVLADVNAVDPTGIEGIKLFDDGKEREGKICFGAIGIGNLKMKVHKGSVARLFEKNNLILDVEEIYSIACKVGGR
ncbi:MAG TPA: NADP-dependent methylenetetrahydromethanopterin/methylenetetrahydrofolate dehydrogenase [Clostridia bacterium]|nr:NADP-dependent methylenetetrahydromethanopterin/methylenetetrahydrofolate dehydrogenase [Clostridia bacterium]